MSFSNKDDTKRNKVVNKLNVIIKDMQISSVLEQSIYNYCIKLSKLKNIRRNWNNSIFINIYLSKVRSIYSNISSNSYIKNETLLNKILNKKIDLKNIANMSNIDLYPENWETILERKSKIDKLKYEIKPEAMTSDYKCRKCSSRSTSYYEVQTRSADEPMTQFITCLNCNNRWKQ